MAFIIQSGNVVAYCEASDILDVDQRLWEANQIQFDNAPDSPATLNDYLEDLAIRATNRVNEKIRASESWRVFMSYTGIDYDINNIPSIDPNLILLRHQDFTDMCVSKVLSEFVLPKIADFGNPESPELQKIQYYNTKFDELFSEVTAIWDWYDVDNSGTISDSERQTQKPKTRRTRGRRSIGYVR
jgi:hypothetical protein